MSISCAAPSSGAARHRPDFAQSMCRRSHCGRAGEVIGEGFHTYDGLKHAEILALEQAGGKARGATLYINLEPCSHQGRTGPCADAIIAAGIARVVACMQDPNPQVSGQGFARLQAAGVAVTTGILESEAKALNEPFAKYIRTHTPLITLKTAMTLDGKIAPPPSESHNPTRSGRGRSLRRLDHQRAGARSRAGASPSE